jgi:ABC-2 type transport system ATP-binding protein
MSGWRGQTAEDRTTGWGAESLTVHYGHRAALEEVSFPVGVGQVAAVIGADGSGKTTLLRALVGTVRPSAGRVRRPPKRRMGYMSAGPGVYRDLTVEENLRFAARAYGVPKRALADRLEELLAATGLSEARSRLAALLSGGMRQKLALAMAVLHKPELLVLDEPTTGLDPVSRAELWRMIAELAVAGTAIALATTYVDEAERAASVLVLLRGRPLAMGTPEAIVAAVPGALYDLGTTHEEQRGVDSEPHAWRRGTAWRLWSPGGGQTDDAPRRLQPDLEDALVMAQLAYESSPARGTAT